MLKVVSQIAEYRGPRQREVVVFDRQPNGQEAVAQPLVFKEIAEFEPITTPTIDARRGVEFLQAALDHAWEIGLRPHGFSDVPLQIEAMREHLADMRALVFGERKLILPMAAPTPGDRE